MKTVKIFENEIKTKHIRWNLKFKIIQKHDFHIFKPKNVQDCLSFSIEFNTLVSIHCINFVKYNQGFWDKVVKKKTERNWVFVTNSNCLIPISLQSDYVNLWYFKLRLFGLTEFIVWNIKDLRHGRKRLNTEMPQKNRIIKLI